MPGAPMPPNEATRLAALHGLGILDSAPDEEFDAIVRVASAMAETPISLISLVDADRQWLKANIGLPGATETPRALAFCGFTILDGDVFEVPDAVLDSRFADNALVTGDPHIRFYAGVPLRLGDGSNAGSLCVIDRQPRQLDARQRAMLADLGRVAVRALESWRSRRLLAETAGALHASEERLRRLYEATPALLHSTDHEGRLVTVSDAWLTRLGYAREEVIGRRAVEFLTPASQEYDSVSVLPALLATGRNDDVQFQAVAKDGDILDVLLSSRMERDAAGNILRGVAVVEEVTRWREAERALRKSQTFLEQTGKVAGVGGWELDLASGALHWAAETFRIHGLEPGEEPPLTDAIRYYAPAARAVIEAVVRRAAATGEPWDEELAFTQADGRDICVRVVGSAVMENGRAVRLIGAIQDVTAQVAERHALARSSERLELAAASGGVGVWEWDFAADRMVWDARMRGLYGIEQVDENQVRTQWRSRLHPADRAAAEQAISDAIHLGQPYDSEFRVVWPDGSVHWIKALGRIHHSRTGDPRRMVGVNWDITEHRRLREELAEQHEMLKVTLQSIADGVITTDAGGSIVWLNPAAERLTGWPAAEAAGRPLRDVFHMIDEESRAAWPDMLACCLGRDEDPCPKCRKAEAGGPPAVARRPVLVSRDGREIGVEESAAPIAGGRGEVLGAVLVFHDVTQQRLAAARDVREGELRVANAELDRLAQHFDRARAIAEQASRAKTRFLAGMSHELRTPLNGILGYAQLLRMDGGLTATQAARVEAMLTAGTHLLEMISCVLDLSEIESGSAELQAAAVDLRVVAAATLNIVRPTAEGKGLRLSLAVEPGVPPLVSTDPARLRQVLLNLLGNAVKFTGSGSVTLRLSCSSGSERQGGLLQFEVADTGPGIPAAQKHRLFEEFERLDAGADSPVEGSGLGLALSRRLAALMGGSLGHRDNPGGGSIFWLDLPLAVEAAASQGAPVRGSGLTATDAAPADGLAKRILVVDDVAMNRDIAAAFIQSVGYEVVCADGGAASVAAAAGADFDAVLMDVSMPDVDGLEATRLIRALPGRRGRVPVVALTAQVFTEQIEACRAAGMDSHVAKPFTLETLVGAIARGVAAAGERLVLVEE